MSEMEALRSAKISDLEARLADLHEQIRGRDKTISELEAELVVFRSNAKLHAACIEEQRAENAMQASRYIALHEKFTALETALGMAEKMFQYITQCEGVVACDTAREALAAIKKTRGVG